MEAQINHIVIFLIVNTQLSHFEGENSSVKQEALYALEKFGFSTKKMHPILDKIIYENDNLSVEELIKVALKTV